MSYCMAALSNAVVRNALTIPSSSDDIVEAWLHTSAPVEVFFDEYVAILDEGSRCDEKLWIKARDVYVRYAAWAKETGHTGVYSETTFGEWLKGKLGISHAEWGRSRSSGRTAATTRCGSSTRLSGPVATHGTAQITTRWPTS